MAAFKIPLLLTLLSGCFARECSRLVDQLGDPLALELRGLQVYVNLHEAGNGLPDVDLVVISGEDVQEPFSSPEAFPSYLQVPTTSSVLPLHIKLLDTGNQTLYYALSVWSLDESVSPSAACPDPAESNISPGEDKSIAIELACSGSGSVYLQGCLTVGTSPFSLLNGTYKTLTFYFQKACDGVPGPRSCDIDDDVVPLEFCMTVEQAQALVNSGEGSWSLLIPIFGGDESSTRGYCLIDANLGGVSPLLQDITIYSQLPISESFTDLRMYYDVPTYITSSVIYELQLDRESSAILDVPYHSDTSPGLITAEQDHKEISITLPCLGPGLTRVFANLTSSGFIDGTLYTESYVFEFYKSCTPSTNDTLKVTEHSSDNVGVKVGVPIAVLFLLGILFAIIVMVVLTRRQRKKIEISRQLELQHMSDGNEYLRGRFSLANAFEQLEIYDLEYNYASIEVVEELGEGEFGRVFKARAPGLDDKGIVTDSEFVAVKSLKTGATDDVELAFIKEVRTCTQFKHSNVIRLLAICTRTPQKCMIFEYMDIGGLNDLLRCSDPDSTNYPGPGSDKVLITPKHFLHCALQVAQGLAYLASLKFIHRDVATRNCLVNHDLVIKIADFGMSREANHMDYYRIGSAEAVLPVRWMPPEALLYGKFTVKSDVWSFGVLMWEIYTFAHQPYGGVSNHEVIDRVKEGRVLDCPELCPASVYDIMKACWVRVPSKRPPMESILTRVQQLIGQSAEFKDRYVTVTPVSVGYANLTVGVAASPSEVEESRRVSRKLNLSVERDSNGQSVPDAHN